MNLRILLLPLIIAPLSAATSLQVTAVADATIYHRDGTYAYNSTNYGTATTIDAAQYGGGIWSMSYIRFDLSSIPAGATITTATFQITQTGSNNVAGFPVSRSDTWTTGRFGSYGLLDVAGNTSQTWGETAITGDSIGSEVVSGLNPQLDTTTRTIDFNSDTESKIDAVISVTGTNLISFLQNRVDASTDTGFATLIVDYMEDATSSARGFTFVSRDDTSSGLLIPTLTVEYELVPEPSAALLGGLGALGLLRRRRR
ncbi:hypothetical protein HNR46_003373 [Haloferula luteola]|uniref:PEP-CTERM protein-sorting domain-containing protein n=1 Tax=Haloferula luteola TaxID=595692 RepID=A0A840VH08_9BACT|nr:PEP-CTERM sorting domain-containing protein [Haloferula luteola]MBB5353120.1 hypothetical protein [Haloferula luteola]